MFFHFLVKFSKIILKGCVTMKIKEIIDSLNKEFEKFNGQKVNVGEFHGEIKETTNKVLNKLGINSLEYCVWSIQFKNIYFKKILNVNLESIDDKRNKWERKGKITRLYYSMLKGQENLENLTIEEYKKEIDRQEKIDWLNNIKESIITKEKEIQELKNQQIKLEKELGL